MLRFSVKHMFLCMIHIQYSMLQIHTETHAGLQSRVSIIFSNLN